MLMHSDDGGFVLFWTSKVKRLTFHHGKGHFLWLFKHTFYQIWEVLSSIYFLIFKSQINAQFYQMLILY